MATADAIIKGLTENAKMNIAMAMPDDIIIKRAVTTVDAIAIVTTVLEEKTTMTVMEEIMEIDNMKSQKATMISMSIMWRKNNACLLVHHQRIEVL